jgi:hypothetical protein
LSPGIPCATPSALSPSSYWLWASVAQPAFAKSRIKDIVEFEGVRENMLVGYGIVVGPESVRAMRCAMRR